MIWDLQLPWSLRLAKILVTNYSIPSRISSIEIKIPSLLKSEIKGLIRCLKLTRQWLISVSAGATQAFSSSNITKSLCRTSNPNGKPSKEEITVIFSMKPIEATILLVLLIKQVSILSCDQQKAQILLYRNKTNEKKRMKYLSGKNKGFFRMVSSSKTPENYHK